MVRIIRTDKKQQSTELDTKCKAILSLLGIAISNEPEQVKNLVENYGIKVSANPSDKELTNKVLFAIEQNRKPFNFDLSEILARQVIPDNYDGFDKEDLAGAVKGANVTVGSDPVSAIAGAIGSLASIFGNAQQKKIMKEQAKNQTMSSIMTYKALQQKAVNEKQKQANQKATLMTVGILALIALFGWFFLSHNNKQQQVQQAMN